MGARGLVAATLFTLAGCTGDPGSRQAVEESVEPRVSGAPAAAPSGVRVDCSLHSEATFRRPFRNPRSIVVGPLALVDARMAARRPARLIRELGGWKAPILVRAGYVVTVRIPESARDFAALGYGPLPQGEIRVRDAHHTVTLVPCRPDEPTYASMKPTVGPFTFWSGAVVVNRAPACVPLEVYVDDDRVPRGEVVSLGAGRCD